MIETKNAIIKKARITKDHHDLLTVWLDLDYGGTLQSFGGYSLYLPKSFKHHALKSFAGHFIWRCLEIADVSTWDQLAGKAIRVRQDALKIHAIGHITKNDWFCPSDDFADTPKDISVSTNEESGAA
jgi:hypothetical protein